jgi:TRAP-type C4-dicarboxylate transport system permease small subunit
MTAPERIPDGVPFGVPGADPDAGPDRAPWRISFEHAAMNTAFVVLVCAIVWGVLSRYVTEAPATWVEEISSIAFAWVVFMGAAEVHRRAKHVSVDLVTSFLPRPLRVGLTTATSIFVALYCFYVAWLGAQQTIASNSAFTSMLHIPLSVPYAGLTIGFLAMGLRGLQRLLRQARHPGP